ncbi:MarR family transcriptional regulator [Kitasatospora sp. NE20-6]|uniref:MarR family winged helix-turn-helix transcriptional regulator n=1 Tax=Kitasatospora sp. NE20-6 TaxID=2859066 RepID=UPI0034DCBA82
MPTSSAPDRDDRALASGLAAVLPVLHRALDRGLALDFPHPRLPDAQLALLLLVGEGEGVTVRAASRALLMKPNNVSALVSRLVEQGLLDRRQDEGDRRVAHLHLTAEARSRIAEAQALKAGYVETALRALTDGEAAALGSALVALRSLTASAQHPAG